MPASSPEQRTAAAEATRRWRERRAKGSRIVPVELFGYEIEDLVKRGLLAHAKIGDREEVGYAVARLVERVIRRARQGT
jgi:hypothetical protein